MRLIDAAPMLEQLDLEHYDNDWYVSQYNADWISSWLDSQPVIEAEPVKHGRWASVEHGMFFRCSSCGSITDFRLTKYCPDCGAKMDLEG